MFGAHRNSFVVKSNFETIIFGDIFYCCVYTNGPRNVKNIGDQRKLPEPSCHMVAIVDRNREGFAY
jgi:hypothetical protein